MSKPKHTPGPWKVVTEDGLTGVRAMRGLANLELWLSDVGSYEKQLANAQLIAAAPEMLEMLRHMVRWNNSELNWDISEVQQMLKALISKAEGDL